MTSMMRHHAPCVKCQVRRIIDGDNLTHKIWGGKEKRVLATFPTWKLMNFVIGTDFEDIDVHVDRDLGGEGVEVVPICRGAVAPGGAGAVATRGPCAPGYA